MSLNYKIICPICNNKNSKNDLRCKKCNAALKIKKYILLKKISEHNSYYTYLGLNIETSNKIIIKRLILDKLDDWSIKERFKKEMNIMSRLNHPKMPKVLDKFSIAKKNLYFILEYIDGISLEKQSKNKTYTIKEVFNITLEIASILDYLHSFTPPLVHRKITPSSFVIKNDKIFLTDFRSIKESIVDSSPLIKGDYGYMSPEQLLEKSTPKSDFYSLGVLIVVLLTKEDPLDMLENDILNWKRYLNNFHGINDKKLQYLLEKLLEISQEKRISSIEEIKNIIIEEKDTIEEKKIKKSLKGGKLIDNKYLLVKKIKSDSLVDLFIAEHVKTGEKLIINRLIVSDNENVSESIIELFKLDAEKLKKMEHKGIPQYIDIKYSFEKNKHIFYTVQKKSLGVSIEYFVKKNKKIFQKDVVRVISNSLDVLDYFYNDLIIHGNITAKNILIKKDFSVSFINFGIIEKIANEIYEENNNNVYTAPERLKGNFNLRNDQYSLGVALVYLTTKKDPVTFPKIKNVITFMSEYTYGESIYSVIKRLTSCKAKFRMDDIKEHINLLKNDFTLNKVNIDYEKMSSDINNDYNVAIDSLSKTIERNKHPEKKKYELYYFIVVVILFLLFRLFISNNPLHKNEKKILNKIDFDKKLSKMEKSIEKVKNRNKKDYR